MGPLVLATILALALLPGTVRAQGALSLIRPSGEIGTDFDGSWVSLQDQLARDRHTFRQWLDLNLGFNLIHPRVFRADLNLRPLLGQSRWNGGIESPNGGIERLDGGGRFLLLSGAPVGFGAWGRKLSDVNRGIFGSRTDFNLREWGAEATSRSWLFPARFEYAYRARDFLSTAPSGRSFREDEITRTARMTVENSKTWVVLERVGRDDRVNGKDFTHNRADFSHRLRWGKGSTLRSQYRYFQRLGIRESSSHNWSESASIRHATSVSSTLFFSRTDGRAGGVSSEGRVGEYQLRYQPNRVIEMAAEALGRTRSFGLGSSTYARVQPHVSLALPVHRTVQFRAFASGGYEWHDQAPSEDAWIAVVGEEHRLDASLYLRLEEAFADRETLVLRSPDGALLYQEGFDYRVLEEGPVLEVFALPGGRLKEGDTVLADYRFRPLPGASADAWVGRYDVSLRLGGQSSLTLFNRRSLQRGLEETAPGAISSLLNYDNMESGATLDWNAGRLNVSAAGEVGWRRSDLFDYSSMGVRGGFRLFLPLGLEASANVSASRREGDGVRFEYRQGMGQLGWTPHPVLRLGADVAFYDWEETLSRRERSWGGGVSAELRISRLLLEARADRNKWEDGLMKRRAEDRLVVRLSRTF